MDAEVWDERAARAFEDETEARIAQVEKRLQDSGRAMFGSRRDEILRDVSHVSELQTRFLAEQRDIEARFQASMAAAAAAEAGANKAASGTPDDATRDAHPHAHAHAAGIGDPANAAQSNGALSPRAKAEAAAKQEERLDRIAQAMREKDKSSKSLMERLSIISTEIRKMCDKLEQTKDDNEDANDEDASAHVQSSAVDGAEEDDDIFHDMGGG
ncbi:hypothetical protein FVE85_9249 [Porphyridium purpureum]|uniref:Uncharacterized protein n=1 Tax=Porphyridium purpureum TaxID=35688 RepID=A0A5J4YRD7_PORPP|nr:hypothetical protein FVE85_9249 [Porphyridium purpureum]|eukprot:POR7800..scf222_8